MFACVFYPFYSGSKSSDSDLVCKGRLSSLVDTLCNGVARWLYLFHSHTRARTNTLPGGRLQSRGLCSLTAAAATGAAQTLPAAPLWLQPPLVAPASTARCSLSEPAPFPSPRAEHSSASGRILQAPPGLRRGRKNGASTGRRTAWALLSVEGGAGRGSRPARGQRAGPRDAAATLPAYCSAGLPAAASLSAPAFPETAAAPLPFRVLPRGGPGVGPRGRGRCASPRCGCG